MIGTRFAGGIPSIFNPADPLSASARAAPGEVDANLAQLGSTMANARKPGVLDRIGDFLQSDQGRAALLRSGAATMQGGLGAGIAAGAGYMDQQHAMEGKARQQQFENGMAERGADLADLRAQQQNDLGWAGVDTSLRQIGETSRHNKAGEQLTQRAQNVDMRGQDVARANNADSNRTSIINNSADNAQADRNSQRSYDASIYGTNVGYLDAGQRAAAGIGSKNQGYSETVTETPAVQASNSWFGSDTPASPKTTTTVRIPMASGSVPNAQAIEALKANPNLRGQFELKYGPGSASQHLGGR